MEIERRRIEKVLKEDIIKLFNNPAILPHMPLAKMPFEDHDYECWIKSKKEQWKAHGFGPWGFFINDCFAGWGGLQFEDGEVDVALVLAPEYWGCGVSIYREICREAFEELKISNLTILLPVSRMPARWLERLGFILEGEYFIEKILFYRYRLKSGDTHPIA